MQLKESECTSTYRPYPISSDQQIRSRRTSILKGHCYALLPIYYCRDQLLLQMDSITWDMFEQRLLQMSTMEARCVMQRLRYILVEILTDDLVGLPVAVETRYRVWTSITHPVADAVF